MNDISHLSETGTSYSLTGLQPIVVTDQMITTEDVLKELRQIVWMDVHSCRFGLRLPGDFYDAVARSEEALQLDLISAKAFIILWAGLESYHTGTIRIQAQIHHIQSFLDWRRQLSTALEGTGVRHSVEVLPETDDLFVSVSLTYLNDDQFSTCLMCLYNSIILTIL